MTTTPLPYAVTLSPLPPRKPEGGYIEIGEYLDGSYAFEGSVEMLAGSDGRVYAVVTDQISSLPDIDPLMGEVSRSTHHHLLPDESTARVFDLRAGWQFAGPFKLQKDDLVVDVTDDDIITDGDCHYAADSGGYWPINRLIRCPKCGGESIFVVQVSCTQHTKPHAGHWPLTADGFVWDETVRHRDGSTSDEIAECDDCRYCCPAGELNEFGFGTPPPAIESDDGLECAECGEPIGLEDEAESTYCGSVHADCLSEHRAHCAICGTDAD